VISLWTAIPFAILLLTIAVLPMVVPNFWKHNRNRAILVAVISFPVLSWLLWHQPAELWHSLHEYVSFIALLWALYVISGGIALTGDLKATPRVNTLFLSVGCVLASVVGTTGASMVLIRAFLKTNSEREHTRHLPVFFIFIVSNCGGLLTPLGDPPLFLGFLRGVPFFWTLTLFPAWLTMNGLLLAIFYIWDSRAYRRETAKALAMDVSQVQPLCLKGGLNFLFLGGVLGAVFLASPLRELLMVGMGFLSIRFCNKAALRENRFSWHPIVEVAILFAGIFITMVPALELLKSNASGIGIKEPWQFFWLTGMLSSFLDNAPAYLTMLSLGQGLSLTPEIVGVPAQILTAISLGAVFMGANTYIGNGPNFMVKSIADHAGFKTPSFLTYMAYSGLVLFPLYGIIHWLFL
jgi:Na+/H+ antiporter NhaD/arsenite permease-like protein